MKRIRRIAAAFITVFTVLLSCVPLLPLNAAAAVSAVWPVDGEYQNITTYFNPNRNYYNYSGYHNAIDIEAPVGANIYAAVDGVCISAGWMGDYGYLIILYHDDLGVYTFYAHCTSMSVSPGQTVKAGDIIGGVGNTGLSYGSHLHFGICDALLGDYPTTTYYDPLNYFSYDAVYDPDNDVTCNCSEEYAGIYVTNGVNTFLNIRSGPGSNYPVIGEIYPDEEFKVTKGNGEWAHVEYKGIIGLCSMEYIVKVEELETGMKVNGAAYPTGVLKSGDKFSVAGRITSNLKITNVEGGVYTVDGKEEVMVYKTEPNAQYYDLSREFDKSIIFNELEDGSYIYRVRAQDESGEVYTLINRVFYVGDLKGTSGDLNGDNKVTIADAYLLQTMITGEIPITPETVMFADINRDSSVDAFDMVLMRKAVIANGGK